MYEQVVDQETRTVNANIIKRTEDGAFIPTDLHNSDYKAYLAWVRAGNTILISKE